MTDKKVKVPKNSKAVEDVSRSAGRPGSSNKEPIDDLASVRTNPVAGRLKKKEIEKLGYKEKYVSGIEKW